MKKLLYLGLLLSAINVRAGGVKTLQLNDSIVCGSGSGILGVWASGGTSPYSIQWTNGTAKGDTSNNSGSMWMYNMANGTYTLTVIDSKGDTGSIVASLNCAPVPLSNYVGTNCNTDSLKGYLYQGYAYASPSGGKMPYTYSWPDGSSGSSDGPLLNGTYTLTVTDAKGAVVLSNFNISCSAPPLYGGISEACNYDTISHTYTGLAVAYGNGGVPPYTFLWSNGISNAINPGLANGIYMVTITDAAGGFNVETVNVNCVLSALGDSTWSWCSTDTMSGKYGTNGSVYTFGYGGVPPYSYRWSDGTTNYYDSPVANGTYTVTVTDNIGNRATSAVTVYCVTPPLSVTAGSYCYMDSSKSLVGYAYANVLGGYGPFTYYWSDGSSASADGPLANASYTVTVSDSKGTTATASVLINCLCTPPSVSYQIFPDSMPHWYWLMANFSSKTVNATWYWGDGSSSSGMYVGHTYSNAGWYKICVTAFNACGDSANYCMNDSIFKVANNMIGVAVKQSKPTGLSEISAVSKSIAVYPNPAKGMIQISYELDRSGPVNLEVYDMLGNKVQTIENQNKAAGSYQTQANLEQFSAGVYFVKLNTENAAVTKRIVLSR